MRIVALLVPTTKENIRLWNFKRSLCIGKKWTIIFAVLKILLAVKYCFGVTARGDQPANLLYTKVNTTFFIVQESFVAEGKLKLYLHVEQCYCEHLQT